MQRIQTNIISIDDTESKLLEMHRIDREIKILEAKMKRLKDEVINTYFVNNEEFVGSEGIVLATYTKQIRNNFMQSEFKKDHPETYKLYSAEQTVSTFRLKK